MKVRLIVVVLLLAAAACNNTTYPPDHPRSAVSPTSPSPDPPAGQSRIEFRAGGNATSARVRLANAQDGLTQVITTLPYTATIKTSETSMFLSLDVTPISYSALTVFPFLSAQIFVDGVLFREATSNEFLLNTLSVSGTWRKE